MRAFPRCLITALAAGCLALTAGTSAAAVTPSAAPAPAPVPASRAAPDPVPGACDVDWAALAGITGTGTLQEAIVACVEAYTKRDLASWLQTSPKLPDEQREQSEQPAEQPGKREEQKDREELEGQEEQEDWTGADAGDWATDLSCDLAELFEDPTACRRTP
ncbi:hypothetical protein ACTMUQ_29290 [Streptomyces sp. SD11]|uniref:hypothetical protein n=1 Tax=Streptomyces sp. SD11 TaxID=3452209 RepID=UPI003F8910AD